jgi:hypothetical protein
MVIPRENVDSGQALQTAGNRVVIALPVRQETAWARMSEEFREVITKKTGHFGGFTALKGTFDDNNFRVHYSSLGGSIANFVIEGTLSRTREGSKLTLAVRDDEFSLMIKRFGILALLTALAAVFAGWNHAPAMVVWLLGGLSIGLSIGVVRQIVGFRRKDKALKKTAEMLKEIACGQLDE